MLCGSPHCHLPVNYILFWTQVRIRLITSMPFRLFCYVQIWQIEHVMVYRRL